MNLFNVIIILMILMTGLVGWKRGVLKEVVFLIGTVLIFIIAFNLKNVVGDILCKYLPFFTFSGNLEGVVTLNILIYQVIAFAFIASVLYGIFSYIMAVTGIMQKIVNATIILALPSKLLGLIIGLIEGYIIMFVILVALAIPLKQIPGYEESSLSNKIIHNTPILSSSVGNIGNAISDIYELVDNINNNTQTTNEINLECLDIMLKYKVVSVKEIKKLDALDKLDTVKNIETVLEKY